MLKGILFPFLLRARRVQYKFYVCLMGAKNLYTK